MLAMQWMGVINKSIKFWTGRILSTKGTGAAGGTCFNLFWCAAFFNPLNANSKKWSNTLKQFVGNLPTNCLSVFDHFVILALKGLSFWQMYFIWYLYLWSFTDATANRCKVLFLPLRLKFYVQFVNSIHSNLKTISFHFR